MYIYCVCIYTHYTYIYIILFFTFSLFIYWWTLRLLPYRTYGKWVNMVQWTWEWRYLFKVLISFPLNIYPEVGLLDHMIVLYLVYWGTFIISSIMTIPIYIPMNRQGFSFLHIFTNTSYLLSLNFFYVYLFILRERERERASEHASGGGVEREGERISSRLHAISAEPDAGVKFMNSEIMTWAKNQESDG